MKNSWSQFTPERLEKTVRALNGPWARRISLRFAETVLRLQRHLPIDKLETYVVDTLLVPEACCPDGGVHMRFLQRYLAQYRPTKAYEMLCATLRNGNPQVTRTRVEAFARIGILNVIRHEVLVACKDRNTFPPVPLVELQIAPYPDCDLACEGCYSKEDRAGQAPTAERLAWYIDQGAMCGATAIHVVGKGEPFLDEARGLALLRIASERPHLLFVIATHGLSLTDRLMDMLAVLGNVFLLVSVDGNEALHDARRGPGRYQRVMGVLEALRHRGILFGISSMVSARSYRDLTEPSFLEKQASWGSSLAVLSRYFPLSAQGRVALALTPIMLQEYTQRLGLARQSSPVPIMDIDEIEEYSGCRSRAGISVHLDGVTGQVTPCIRTPFSPGECRIDPAGRSLAQVLRHPFFAQYRSRQDCALSWCGSDLGAELSALGRALKPYDVPLDRLETYRLRVNLVSVPEATVSVPTALEVLP